MFTHLDFDLDEGTGIATVTLNRPHAMNAITQTMLEDFERLWLRARSDDAIRLILLRGHPDSRGFTSGADVKGGDDGNDRIARHDNVFANRPAVEYLSPRWHQMWKPIVTAVHGVCAGAGLFLINESDIVLCAPDAQFFDPHLSIGITSAIGPVGMSRRVNLGEVLRFTLMSNTERLGAETAVRIGLATEIVVHEKLMDRAMEIAAIIAGHDTVAVQGSLKGIWQGMDIGRAAAIERASLYSDAARASSPNRLKPLSGKIPYSVR